MTRERYSRPGSPARRFMNRIAWLDDTGPFNCVPQSYWTLQCGLCLSAYGLLPDIARDGVQTLRCLFITHNQSFWAVGVLAAW